MATVFLIAAILCALYGVLVMMVGSGTWFFAFWYVVAALLLGVSWAIRAGWWDSLPATARQLIGAVCAVALCGFCVVCAFILSDFGDDGEPGLDHIVVLGAQVREQGPSIVLKRRLDAAYDYLRENEDTICIVSGGQGPNEPETEAEAMAGYLVERGIGPGRIVQEAQSQNTAQNIAFSAELFDPATDRVGIVTNNFHLFRALAIARKAGIANAVGIAAGSSPLFLPNNVVRETLGIAKDYLVHNL